MTGRCASTATRPTPSRPPLAPVQRHGAGCEGEGAGSPPLSLAAAHGGGVARLERRQRPDHSGDPRTRLPGAQMYSHVAGPAVEDAMERVFGK